MKLLHIAQTPSPNTLQIAQASFAAMQTYAGDEVHCISLSPTEVIPASLDDCGGLVLGTVENIGAMAGLTKDMFDRCYNQWLDAKQGLPVAFYIKAGLDGKATMRNLTAIAQALKWRLIAPPLILHGPYRDSMCEEAAQLSGQLAAGIDAGIY